MKMFSAKGMVLLALLAAAAFLFVSEINSNPLFLTFNRQNVGSFEYIRMGEKLLDKGLYNKAISFYEKAHESSPENPAINSDLIFVYSKYAAIFAESTKFDEAIEYLTKAYNIRQDSSTIQNLAIMYARKALQLAQKGESQKAVELFNDARAIAYGSARAARNLGISLSNDGVMEFNNGREETALLCLKESSLIYQDGRALVFLGDVYYKTGDLRRAFFYWRRAKSILPKDSILTHKIRRAAKEIRLASFRNKIDLPHFDVKYDENLGLDTALVSAILEKAYFDVGRDMAYFPEAKTGVFLYSRADFKNIFKMPAVVRAFYDGSIRMPMPDGKITPDECARQIYHEYTHAALSAKNANNCPVWLSEGIAVWEEFKKSGSGANDFPVEVRDIDGITLDSLNKEFESAEIGPNRTAYYLLSYTVVAYIVDSWGVSGLQDILKRVAGGQHIVNAIDDEFLLSERDFERRWRIYVRNKHYA